MSDNATVLVTSDKTLDYFQAICAALAMYNSIEVIALTLESFKRYNTLYFWSICVCAVGIIWFAAGFMDLFYNLWLGNSTIYRPLFILTIGWYGMVTGFALVMYSRLHLVNVPKQYIRYVKYFIIYNVIFSHFPTTVLTFGTFVVKSDPFVNGYSIMEKLQMTMFCLQEVILGTLYLVYTQKLKLSAKMTPVVRKTMYINIAVLMLDISMLICEYANLYNYQIMLKCVVYSIKLKLEFFILNVLTKSLYQGSDDSRNYLERAPKAYSTKTRAQGNEVMPTTADEESGAPKSTVGSKMTMHEIIPSKAEAELNDNEDGPIEG